jgi:hypothetical protein
MYKLGDKISIRSAEKVREGRLVGIDTYTLENFENEKISWRSFTLLAEPASRHGRFWFVCWGKSEWILWLAADRNEPGSRLRMQVSKSGIASIRFKGDAGVSTPVAALAQYRGGRRYFCQERFSGSQAMFFDGFRIPKPKVVK